MSNHKLNIDIKMVAVAIQTMRAQLDILEELIEDALLRENKHE